MKFDVESFDGEMNLVRRYTLSPKHKKYGNLRYVESTGFNGGPYKASIFSESGSEVMDKDMWDGTISAVAEYVKRKNEKEKPRSA